jgi:hypothetical protein
MKQVKRNTRISCVTQKDGSIDIVVPASMAEDFKEMVKKGTNLSPNMHVEIRDFTDRILGRDYYVGSCMKEAIYGHQTYAQLKEAQEAKDIVSTHWDIPSEDKFEVEQTKQYLGIVKKD